jgi:hypothetical protein
MPARECENSRKNSSRRGLGGGGLEGSRFGTWAKDLPYSFQCEEGENIWLSKRLPGITQRDVLSIGSFE